MLATPRHRGLQQAPGDEPDAAGEEYSESHQLDARRILAATAAIHDARRQIGDHEQAEDPRGETHVDLHVAVENVTELVADDGLQLIAIEFVQRALGHRDGGFVGRMPGGEGVDAGFIRQHVHRWFADARRDGHFFDDVQQTLALEIFVLRQHRHAAEGARNHHAAGAQLRAAMPGRDEHGAEHDERDPRHVFGVIPEDVPWMPNQADDDHQVDDHGHHQQRGNKGHHQPFGLAALGLLAFEKLRAHRHKLAGNHRFGRALEHADTQIRRRICDPFNGCAPRSGSSGFTRGKIGRHEPRA